MTLTELKAKLTELVSILPDGDDEVYGINLNRKDGYVNMSWAAFQETFADGSREADVKDGGGRPIWRVTTESGLAFEAKQTDVDTERRVVPARPVDPPTP